jgi:transcriptional regulator with XRE-family HTH domain
MAGSRLYDTQGKIAAKAKVDQKTVSRILLLQNEPSLDKLEKIAGVFGYEAWQLLVPTFDPLHPPVLADEVTA